MKEEFIISQCEANMESAQISEQTRALLLCRAKLNDIYATVTNVVKEDYPLLSSVDDMFTGFSDTFNEFDSKLMEIIKTYVEAKPSKRKEVAMIEEKEEFKDGRIKLVFDSNNPFVKMAVEIFHQFLIDEASGALNATTTLWSNAKLLQRTFTEERKQMVIHNKF